MTLISPPTLCSKFEKCSAPKCPLDSEADTRPPYPDDEKCTMAAATRHKYWQKLTESQRNSLTWQGYTRKAYLARVRWSNLPQAIKNEKTALLHEARKALPRKAEVSL